MTRDLCINWEAGSKVPAAEVERRADDQVRDLGHDLSANEGHPVVGFRLLDQTGWISSLFFTCACFSASAALTFFSRVSKRSRLCRKNGCIWLMHPGATKMKLKTAKTRSWRSKEPSPIFQKVNPLKRAAKMCKLILFQT